MDKPIISQRNKKACIDCGASIDRLAIRCRSCSFAHRKLHKKSDNKDRKRTGTCVDCGVAITNVSTRCQTCYHNLQKRKERIVKPRSTRGKTGFCIDCGAIISSGAIRCKPCKGLTMCKPESDKSKCIDCGVVVERENSRCRPCWLKYKEANWTCIDCGAVISRRSVRCKPCKGKAMRKPDNRKRGACVDCGVSISNKSIRCRTCYHKKRQSEIKKSGIQDAGKPKTKRVKKCIDCGTLITDVSTRCQTCHHKHRLGTKSVRKVKSPINTCADCGKVIQKRGTRCKECQHAIIRKTEDDYRKIAHDQGFTWIGELPYSSSDLTDFKCPNGHTFKSNYNRVRYGHGCPSCLDYANGYRTSREQKAIFSMIGGTLNHKVGRYAIDVALQLAQANIAVEYDTWWWHGNKQDNDERKTKSLIGQGWKVLRIKTNTMIPTFDQIQGCIFDLLAGADYAEIVMPDWGKGKAR